MKIAYVTETWPPEVNGVALTVARTVAYLRSRGHQVEVIRPRQSSDDHGDADSLLVRGIPIPLYPDLRMGLPSQKLLFRRWTDAPPDLVHIATEGPLGWSASKAARRLGIVATSDFRTRFDEYGRHYVGGQLFSRLVNAYLRMFHNDTACTFVPTPEMRLVLQKSGFHNLLISERGVDADRFSPLHRSEALRTSWGLSEPSDDSAPVALYVGRLAREKNLDLVFQAFDAVREKIPQARLIVVGDGPMRKEVEAAHPEAIFAGVRTGHALAACYASADLFLFPSLTETFGNVTFEAMASGLPVVAYASGAAGMHIRNGVNGYAVAPNDSGAFIAAACELASDPHLRLRMSVAARRTAETRQWKDVLARFEAQIVETALSRSCNDIAKLANS